MSALPSSRLSSLPLPPRAAPVRCRKRVNRAASGRLIYLDRETAGKFTADARTLPRISDMPLDVPVLIVDAAVPPFKVEHVGAALKAHGARGYWLVELQARPCTPVGNRVAETLTGFPGLRIARIGSAEEL